MDSTVDSTSGIFMMPSPVYIGNEAEHDGDSDSGKKGDRRDETRNWIIVQGETKTDAESNNNTRINICSSEYLPTYFLIEVFIALYCRRYE